MPIDPLIARGQPRSASSRAQEAIAALEARTAHDPGRSSSTPSIVIAAIDDVETPDHVREMMRLDQRAGRRRDRVGRAFIAAGSQRGEYRTLGDPTVDGPEPTHPWPTKPKQAREAQAKRQDELALDVD